MFNRFKLADEPRDDISALTPGIRGGGGSPWDSATAAPIAAASALRLLGSESSLVAVAFLDDAELEVDVYEVVGFSGAA